ncbi:2'-5' RNA ligase family protein [Legionella steelei]|uniref:2'-5' RNA ligase family protein n=1 Tax=Legionella steelei TaxID=947033 RepID=UPI0012EE9FB5|nr:2'-5' RNA ligase family protein [Legionella steelei]
MRNRITNNCKTLGHLTLLFGLICCFIANTVTAKSLSINVYLKLKPENHIKALIKELNQYLAQQGLFAAYQITPYLQQHPLHITLYLADYSPQKIPAILRTTKELAKQQKPILFSTAEFIPSRSGYVMLTVRHDKTIHELSNKTLNVLAHFRNPHASIPAWAAQDPERQALFRQYGSPSVLDYFNPHFSIFSAESLNTQQSTFLYQQLHKLIHQFSQSHQTQIEEHVDAIGVGIADTHGQIVKELAVFTLEP